VAVADDGSDAGERSEFVGGALRVTASGDDPGCRIETMSTPDAGPGLAIGLRCDAAGVYDDYIGFGWRILGGSGRAQERGNCFSVGAGGATPEILDVEG
jgi:hypothetical protein